MANSFIKNLREVDIEFRAAIGFALVAFLVSLITGLIAGVNIGIVLLRVFFALIIFSVIGYFSCSVIKKYAPEVFDVFFASRAGEDVELNADTAGNESADGSENGVENDGGFMDLKVENFPKINKKTVEKNKRDILSANVNLGKHSVTGETEYEFDYQPEEMAKAVRTMMKKDDN